MAGGDGECTHLALSQNNSFVLPNGPRLASSNLENEARVSDCFRSQFHFCCPMQALTAKASDVLETVPKADISIFMDAQHLQAVKVCPFIQAIDATAENIAPMLMNMAPISHIQEKAALRLAGSSSTRVEASLMVVQVRAFMVEVSKE